ncbi:MAG TPA: NAD-dependent epimerase/dehydratase family protein, partial [Polyangiaceae bacterium]
TYKLLDAIRTGAPVVLYDGGRMWRDWTFVSDIVAGIVAAVDAPLGYEIVNLGRGKPVLVSDYIAVFERITGKKVPFEETARLDSDIERTHANIDKARRLLGYAPRVDVEEGAQKFVDWYERALGPTS